jgi:TPR repeat protein
MTDLATWQARAAQGEAEAQFQLGLLYDNAEGVPRDPVAAANWYRFAADQGHE